MALNAHTHTHTLTHKYTHTHTHTRTHTYIQAHTKRSVGDKSKCLQYDRVESAMVTRTRTTTTTTAWLFWKTISAKKLFSNAIKGLTIKIPTTISKNVFL